MVECPSCRTEAPYEARFCASCGAVLGSALAAPAPVRRQERRVVTTLFCDLVGFTSVSEAADPEDLDRMLGRYFTIARAAIERHGGVVEKFIGDAVVGVFGAPSAHEDDPARAVRAGLEICAGATELCMPDGTPLTLRVGVNTGEAFVHLDVRPDSGEHLLVGDAVNTAARIQSAAPVMGVAVGARTWQATRLAFDYERLAPATLKGKAEPVELFHARAEVHRAGVDAARSHAGPFVGRTAELGQLIGAWRSVRDDRRSRLAVIEGEPGIGKSRILAELRATVERDEPGARWRQGRCLPYGDGTGFWAFGEIVKTHAGVRDGDDPDAAVAALRAMVDGEPDASWLLDTLRPLLGMDAGRPVDRDERVEAWRRVVRRMAGDGPLVVALEDVHWADPGLLAFIETLASQADAAILVVATTRPSVREVAPAFGEGVPDSIRVTLAPLDDADTEALVTGLLGDIVPRELHEPILRRSEGNPLYAEEFVRLLGDRDLLERVDGAFRLRAGATIPLPESIHGLLAARLDELDAGERSVLTAASVVGQAFWPGAVTAIGPAVTEVERALAGLAQRQLVRPLTTSTMTGEPEFGFWHVLARDVAYGSLPRRARVDAHLAVADWIRGAAAGRSDVAAIVAHHVVAALELAEAAHDAETAAAVRPRAVDALAHAAATTMALDAAAGVALYRRALALVPPGSAGRAALLYAFGRAASEDGAFREAADALEEALAQFQVTGDTRGAARAMAALRLPLILLEDARWRSYAAKAVDLLEPFGPSADLVAAYIERAISGFWETPPTPALEDAERALDMADALGLPAPTMALQVRGQARLGMGDMGGFEDFERAYDEAMASGRWAEAIGYGANYSAYRFFHEGPAAGLVIDRRSMEIAEAHGLRAAAVIRRLGVAGGLWLLGEMAAADELLDEVERSLRADADQWAVRELLIVRLEMALARADAAAVTAHASALSPFGDVPSAFDTGIHSLLAAAYLEIGQPDTARRRLVSALDRDRDVSGYWMYLAMLSRVAIALGDLDAARDVTRGVSGRSTIQRCGMASSEALVAEAEGRLEEAVNLHNRAAAAWASFGVPLEVAYAELGAGRCLARLGRAEEARARLAIARDTAARIGATAVTREIDAVPTTLDDDAG